MQGPSLVSRTTWKRARGGHPHLRFPLLLLACLCAMSRPGLGASFRVGVVGPWECDPVFAKALPDVAAQLAVNRINKDPSLSYAATFDYTVLHVSTRLPCWTTPKKLIRVLSY